MGFRLRNVDPLYTLPGTFRTEFTHNHGVSALWDAVLKGKTLADIIAVIFTGVATALQRVKKGLSDAWDGVVEGGHYFAKSILPAILQGIFLANELFIQSIVELIAVLTPSLNIRYLSTGQIQIGSGVYGTGFFSNSTAINFEFPEEISFGFDLISDLANLETLSPNSISSEQLMTFAILVILEIILPNLLIGSFAAQGTAGSLGVLLSYVPVLWFIFESVYNMDSFMAYLIYKINTYIAISYAIMTIPMIAWHIVYNQVPVPNSIIAKVVTNIVINSVKFSKLAVIGLMLQGLLEGIFESILEILQGNWKGLFETLADKGVEAIGTAIGTYAGHILAFSKGLSFPLKLGWFSALISIHLFFANYYRVMSEQ